MGKGRKSLENPVAVVSAPGARWSLVPHTWDEDSHPAARSGWWDGRQAHCRCRLLTGPVASKLLHDDLREALRRCFVWKPPPSCIS